MTDSPTTPGAVDERGSFVHLHVHTAFSLLDGFGHLDQMVAKAKADGMPALAQTDHGSLGGSWKFAHECRKQGIKPILGIEAYLSVGGVDRFNPTTIDIENDLDVDGGDNGGKLGTKTKRYEHLTILAATEQGWRNLVRINNEAQNSFHSKPLMDYELIKQYSEGLIVLTGCLGGPVAGPIARGDMDLARDGLEQIIDAVGADNVYVELMYHEIDLERRALNGLKQLADEYDLPVIVTGDCHYVHEEDALTHEVWLADQSKRTIDDPKAFKFNGAGYHLKTPAEMRDVFPDSRLWQEGCDNTVALAERVEEWVLPEERIRLPKFPLLPDNHTEFSYLEELVWEGVERRYDTITADLEERVEFELGIIDQMGYPGYFLIVWEMIGWAREQGILVGPGRGSGAGSVALYALEITDVEPTSQDLLFERFLEPGRVGMPDIDTDFEQARIPEILQHLKDLYGQDRVAQLGTFAFTRTKAALKAAAKTLGWSALGQKMSNLVPSEGGKPLKFSRLLDRNEEAGAPLRVMVDPEDTSDEADRARQVLRHAVAMEDMVRNWGIHACGVIVSADSLLDLVPLRKLAPSKDDKNDAGETVVTQQAKTWITTWDGNDCEQLGLLKLDALSIRNLDIAHKAVDMIEADTGEELDLRELDPNDTDDPKVRAAYETIGEGRTAGLFQLEASGMTELAQDVQPHGWDDLTALGALYRPGPMNAGSHTSYAARKRGDEKKLYNKFLANRAEAELVDSVLGNTFGLMVYQEQVMQLAGVVAGFDAAERSKLRKAMGKKDPAAMNESAALFRERAVKEFTLPDGTVSVAFTESSVSNLLDMIRGAGSYLFNKSHAAAYGKVTFWTAWLKANYPAHFAAATLAVTDDPDRRATLLNSLSADGVRVLPPSINSGQADTHVVDASTIRLGLSEIAQLTTWAGRIVAAHRKFGDFETMQHVADRVTKTDTGGGRMPVSGLVALIEAGACDDLGERSRLLAGLFAPERPDVVEWDMSLLERSTRQRNRLGLALGEHPLDRYAEDIAELGHVPGAAGVAWHATRTVPELVKDALDEDVAVDDVTVMGVLVAWATRPYSRGQMASWTLEHSDGTVLQGSMFDRDLRKIWGTQPTVGRVVTVQGRVKARAMKFSTVDETGAEVETETVRVEMIASDVWELEVGVSDPAVPAGEAPAPVDWVQLLDDVGAPVG